MASQQGESTVAGTVRDSSSIRRLWSTRHALAGALLAGVVIAVAAILVMALGHGSRYAAARGRSAGDAAQGASGARTDAGGVQGAARAHAYARRGGETKDTPTRAARSIPLTGHAAGAAGAAAPGAKVSPGVAAAAGDGSAVVAEAPDPEEARSFPAPATVHHALATKPSTAAEEVVAPGAPSNAEVRAELQRMHAVERAARKQETQALSIVPGGDSIGGNGQLPIPQGVPEVVQRVIAGANAIADFPYVFGGGHASFVSNSYDCSGSVSYALAAGGLLSEPETSGSLESWGAPGPGRWITIYANAGHVYMYVNIGGRWMRFDTVGRSGEFASRWQPEIRSNAGFVARHWPGL